MPTRKSRRSVRRSKHAGGRVGAALAAAASAGLMAAAGPAAAQVAAPTTWLHQGSHGGYVTRVQRALHIRRSGHFDRRTRRAVLAFQRKDRLLVDGIVGPQTWDALFKITPPQPVTPSPAPASTAAPAAGSGGYSIPSGIVQCESGGNYGAVNPSSGAGGAYQILPSTWQAYGGQGLPQNASPAEQNRIAAQIYASQGPSAWTC